MRLINADQVEQGFKELCSSPYFKQNPFAREGAETLMILCVRSDDHKDNTIDAAPVVHARWEVISTHINVAVCRCSHCKRKADLSFYDEVPYCWNCGAKMDMKEGL